MRFFILLYFMLLVGCGNIDENPYQSKFQDMCNHSSIPMYICGNNIEVIHELPLIPTREEINSFSNGYSFDSSFNYKKDKKDEWRFIQNNPIERNIPIKWYGDCEDYSITFVEELIKHGIDPKLIKLVIGVIRLTTETKKINYGHFWIEVDLPTGPMYYDNIFPKKNKKKYTRYSRSIEKLEYIPEAIIWDGAK